MIQKWGEVMKVWKPLTQFYYSDERNEYKAESKEWKRKYFSLQIKEKIDKDTGEIHF